jgi:hypothetical protein
LEVAKLLANQMLEDEVKEKAGLRYERKTIIRQIQLLGQQSRKHKRENVLSYLSQEYQGQYRGKLQRHIVNRIIRQQRQS